MVSPTDNAVTYTLLFLYDLATEATFGLVLSTLQSLNVALSGYIVIGISLTCPGIKEILFSPVSIDETYSTGTRISI